MTAARLTLVHDGECDFCRRLASWIERHYRRGTPFVAPNQQAGLVVSLAPPR